MYVEKNKHHLITLFLSANPSQILNCQFITGDWKTIPSYYNYNGNYYSLSNLKFLLIFVIMKEKVKTSNVSNYSRLEIPDFPCVSSNV